MATPARTQKQIAERYKGNLGYYKKKHPWRRARHWIGFLTIVGGAAAIVLFQLRGRETFFNTGEISADHAHFGDNCASCHDNTLLTRGGFAPSKFLHAASERFRHGVKFDAVERKCEACHQQHNFHAPNVIENRACSLCHMEHKGPERLQAVASKNCATCHANSEVMRASAEKGMQTPGEAYHRQNSDATRVVFALPRPPEGYTRTFKSFAEGHPPFQIEREKARDPDVLRFNHQRHFASDIPQVGGKQLDCNYCHKLDSERRYFQRISFTANCQACHSLQFDVKNPELTLPHGNAVSVRAFVRTLPTQYAELAVKKGVPVGQIQSFVAKQMTQLKERVRTGEDFERQIFFTTDPYKLPGRGAQPTRSAFHGCAYCHEVKPAPNAAPIVTKPVFVDRWMPHAQFNHEKHESVRCDDCHRATQSRETADVLMPGKESCVTCHSPKGKVESECITCHIYHNRPVTALPTAENAVSFKQMLLGKTR